MEHAPIQQLMQQVLGNMLIADPPNAANLHLAALTNVYTTFGLDFLNEEETRILRVCNTSLRNRCTVSIVKSEVASQLEFYDADFYNRYDAIMQMREEAKGLMMAVLFADMDEEPPSKRQRTSTYDIPQFWLPREAALRLQQGSNNYITGVEEAQLVVKAVLSCVITGARLTPVILMKWLEQHCIAAPRRVFVYPTNTTITPNACIRAIIQQLLDDTAQTANMYCAELDGERAMVRENVRPVRDFRWFRDFLRSLRV